MKRVFFGLAALVGLLLIVVGCGGSSQPSSGLVVKLSDAPAAGVTAVDIVIDRVDAHLDGKWQTISDTQQSYNLLDLKFDAATIAAASLPPGNYNQVRLMVSSATVTDDTGTHPVEIPSNLQTGIKVNINAPVNEGEVTVILLDFNVEKSLVEKGDGSYLLQPVIPAVLEVLSGTVTGNVTKEGVVHEGATVTAVYVEGDNYPIGTEVNTGVSDADGNFKIWALLEGKYDVIATWTDEGTTTTYSGSVLGAVVTAGNDTGVGTIDMVPVP